MKSILMLLLIVAIIYFMINAYVKEQRQFKPGHNPYARICRKCGAHQHQHRSNVEGFEHHTKRHEWLPWDVFKEELSAIGWVHWDKIK